ncbi:MAG TPA: putative O-glycosylation ligase, exosortase A system-associated, partial [Stellaceae bacterium]|nr:putative O-glycosylation ligase, exosortase A system-associated [Stellaceae bacterium]
QDFRVALVAGTATLLGWIVSREAKAPPNAFIVYALAGLTLWVSLAALFAIHPEIAIPKWEEIIKILLMTFVTMCIVQSRARIDQLVWVIAISIGIYGLKGGLFAIATGGHYRVYGPADSFIADNNSLACALIMILPLFQYLRRAASSRWVRLGLLGSMGLTTLAILASYSRGALVGLTVTLVCLFLRTRYRVTTMLVTVGVLAAALYVAPVAWFQRMDTIDQYQQDASVQGRFDAWNFAYKLALDHPILGGGQLVGLDSQLFKHYVPTAPEARAAHSIYFEVLGETGFVGLAIFLALLMASFLAARNVMRLSRDHPELAWADRLAAMLQVSFIGYAVTGAFLSLGFFDLYYALVAVITVTQLVVRRELAKAGNAAPRNLGIWPTRLPLPAPVRPAASAASRSTLAGP